jgi:hypothetical protein
MGLDPVLRRRPAMSTGTQYAARGARTYAGFAYGVRFHSVVPLPASTGAADGLADAEVRWADLDGVRTNLLARWLPASVTDGETGLSMPGIGTFLVRDGREVLVDPDPDGNEALLQLALLGPVLAALLHQRGDLVLHASAVEIDGAAIGFLGGRGAGKSTMAAALLRRGYPLLTDDILAVSLEDGSPRVLPGFPQLKLWPDAVVALGGDPVLLPLVCEGEDKRAQTVAEFPPARSLPLACLYVLAGGDTLAIEQLSSRDAFLEVVSNSYGITWLHGVSGPGQFAARAELVRRVPVRRLRRPPGVDLVAPMTRLVEEDLGTR